MKSGHFFYQEMIICAASVTQNLIWLNLSRLYFYMLSFKLRFINRKRLTKWKGERGGGRGSLLAGGLRFGCTLGFDFVETGV